MRRIFYHMSMVNWLRSQDKSKDKSQERTRFGTIAKKLFFALCAFFAVLLIYHLLHTSLVYGASIMPPFLFALLKDLVWFWWTAIGVGIVLWFWLVKGSWISRAVVQLWRWSKARIALWLGVILCGLLVWSVGYSFAVGIELPRMLIGIKYGILPLMIIFTGVFLWSILVLGGLWSLWALGQKSSISTRDTKRRNSAINTTLKWLLYGICGIVVVGFLWQWGKILFPELFFQFWYGPVGDYIAWSSPPIRYRTWPWGMMRRQGIFAWPNNYWYFLTWLFPIVLFAVWKLRSSLWGDFWRHFWRRLAWISLACIIIAGVATLSRWTMLAFALQWVLFWVFFLPKRYKKRLFGFLVAVCVALVWISVWSVKQGSTIARLWSWQESLTAFMANPLWYWLGSSWPAIHFSWSFLPENQYLQILLDVGIIGFVLWVVFFVLLAYRIRTIGKTLAERFTKNLQYALYVVSLGVVWILIIWLFLHSLEDSMVNYLILWPFGLLVGMFYTFSHLPPASDKKRLDDSLDIGDKHNQ